MGTNESSLSEMPVDFRVVASWMDEHGLGSGPLTEPELLAGGTQNILIGFKRNDRSFVLRRPPLHKRSNSDETIRREARVLRALASSDVPHPRLVAAESTTEVLGAAFYLMERIDGFNPGNELPEPHRSTLAMQHRMGLAMAEAIAALGSIEPARVGLDRFGNANGWLERQVPRWRAQLDSYSDLPGYGSNKLHGVEQLIRWLDAHRPTTMRAGLIHGDFHFANVLVSRTTAEIAAVVDWELATTGHPLLDLAHLLGMWPGTVDQLMSPDLPGLPSIREVVDRYADHSALPMEELAWFRVLACYRLGIILEGSYARACAGQTTTDIGERLHAMAVCLFERAARIVGGDDNL